MYHCTISAKDIHCNLFSYYTINAYIRRVQKMRDDDARERPTSFVKPVGYLILNLRDALNGYVLSYHVMTASYVLYSR